MTIVIKNQTYRSTDTGDMSERGTERRLAWQQSHKFGSRNEMVVVYDDLMDVLAGLVSAETWTEAVQRCAEWDDDIEDGQ